MTTDSRTTTGIENPLPGITTYPNELGYRVIIWHYSADPVKDEEWVAEASRRTPGGVEGEDWQQEQEINHHVIAGRPTFFAFNRRRNCIDTIPVPMSEFRTWTHFLSVDYGYGAAPTCWLFWAENPLTRELIIYDSVYVHTEGREAWAEESRTCGPIARVVHQKLREWFAVPPDAAFDIRQHVQYAIGDPAGKGFALEYGQSAYPIYVGAPTLDASLPRINDIMAGEQRVNTYLSPAFLCCPDARGLRQPIFAEWAECPICGEKRRGVPRLRILKPNCPELVRQLETLRKRVPLKPELEQSKENVKAPDHAADSCRYGAMSRSPEAVRADKVALPTQTKLDPASLAFHAHREKVLAHLYEEQQRDLMGLQDEVGYGTLFPEEGAEDGSRWM